MNPSLQAKGLRIAVEGCGHGTLNAIYAAVEKACEARTWDSVDLLIIGGDFQAARNASDLNVMSIPAKFREIGDFHEYYSGSRKAPYLTIFVGGNHEASSHLWELYYGGWVAPNIYYMGAANVIRLGPLRIAGMSGIWKGYNFNKTHHERLPYNQDDIKSIYHVRELDIRKLLQIRTQVDIGISHDWPRAIEREGDERHLFRMKPDFEQESKDGTLGNQAATYIMDRLRPSYWFAAHMHCKFAATKIYEIHPQPISAISISSAQQPVRETDNGVEASGASEFNQASRPAPAHNSDEIDLDMDDDEPSVATNVNNGTTSMANDANQSHLNTNPSLTAGGVPEDIRALLPAAFSRPVASGRRLPPGQPCPATITNTTVRFLALDKCLPGRKFLQLLDISPCSSPDVPSPSSAPRYRLEYDPEWLAITRVFASSLILGDRNAKTPQDLGEEHYRPLIEAEETWVDENIAKLGKLTVPENFMTTAPIHDVGMPDRSQQAPQEYNNPQMTTFCDLVGIENLFFATDEEKTARMAVGPAPTEPRRDGGRGPSRGGRRGMGGGGGRGGGRGRGNRGARGRGRGW